MEGKSVWCTCPLKLGLGCKSCIAKAEEAPRLEKLAAENRANWSRIDEILDELLPEPDRCGVFGREEIMHHHTTRILVVLEKALKRQRKKKGGEK